MCKCCEEENKIDLTEEEIDNIIVERYNDKDEKTKVFIRKALRVHGDKYDYSKTVYVKNRKLIIIICKEHGEFLQRPDNHLVGKGCKLCSIIIKSEKHMHTTKEFIKKAKEAHGDKYDYSKTNYTGSKNTVIITCPTHGDFEQIAANHLRGDGCSSCSGNKKLTTEEFIKKAREVHGDKYDYSKTVYRGSSKEVIITCPIHGDFEQVAGVHLHNHECPSCSGNSKHTTEEFIENAKKIHGNKYDYSKVSYINAYTNVEIVCPVHGSFWQTPHNHLHGRGCSDCNNSIGENLIKAVLDSQSINYDQRVTVKDSNDGVMYPDFVLLDFSIWIEYNGLQHYKYSDDFFHKNIDDFIYQLNRDIRKRVYCKENNIQLIEIPYTFNKPEKIADFLDKVLIQHIDPNTLVDYSKLYKLENTGLNLEDLFPT